jgi:hypothetical protein
MLKSNFAMGAGGAGADATMTGSSAVAATGKFVIHLCSVGAPITIPQPRSPELVRYRFFLHTCWEEGVKRHRLYMGHFATRPEAEKWLETLRRIYPSAFVSEAPRAEVLSAPQIVSLLDQGPAPVQRRPMATPAPVAPSAPPRAAATQTAQTAPRISTGQTGMFRALQVPEKPPAKPGTSTTQKRRRMSLEDTLEDLKAATPDFDEEDSLSETGVRHLKIEIQDDGARSKGKRPGARK